MIDSFEHKPELDSNQRPLGWRGVSLFTFTIFYLQFLPTDLISVTLGSSRAKLGIWAGLFAASIVMLGLNWRRGRLRIDAPLALGFIMLLALWAALRNIIEPPVFSYRQALSLVVLSPLAALLGSQVATNKRIFFWTLWGLGAVYFLAAFITLVSGGFPARPGGFHVIYDPWPWPQTWYQNTTLFMGIFALMGWFYLGPTQSRGWANVGFSVLALVAVMFLPHLGGRAAILGVLVATMICFVGSILVWFRTANTSRDLRSLAGSTWRSAVFVGVCVVALFDPLNVPRDPIEREGTLASRRSSDAISELWGVDQSDGRSPVELANDPRQDYTGSYRLMLYSAAATEWVASPSNFVVGIGPQAFPPVIGAKKEGWCPHNLLLEALCEYGLIGGILLAGPFVVMGWRTCRWLKSSDVSGDGSTIFGIALVAMFVSIALVTGSLSTVWPTVFLTFVLMPLRSNTRIRSSEPLPR